MKGTRILLADPSRPTDLAVLRILHHATFPHDPHPVYRTGLWWIVWDGLDPVAFGGSLPKGVGGHYLCRAGVLPTARGRGIQVRLIRVRLKAAEEQGMDHAVSDCTLDNAASANNLIRCGFRVHWPINPWGLATSIHWRKEL